MSNSQEDFQFDERDEIEREDDSVESVFCNEELTRMNITSDEAQAIPALSTSNKESLKESFQARAQFLAEKINPTSSMTQADIYGACKQALTLSGYDEATSSATSEILAGHFFTLINSRQDHTRHEAIMSIINNIKLLESNSDLKRITVTLTEAVRSLHESTIANREAFQSLSSSVQEMQSQNIAGKYLESLEAANRRLVEILAQWCVLQKGDQYIRLPVEISKLISKMQVADVINMFSVDPTDLSANQAIIDKLIEMVPR